MKSYAVLLAPEFRLQATLRHLPELSGQPVALLDSDGPKPRISELNAKAGGFHVQIGMTPTQALARCAGYCVRPAVSGSVPGPPERHAIGPPRQMSGPSLEALVPRL